LNNELSKDNYILRIHGGVNIYIDEDEFNKLKLILKDKSTDCFEIRGKFIMKSAVQYIVSAADMEIVERKGRGEWQCEKGHWNSRGAQRCDKCYY